MTAWAHSHLEADRQLEGLGPWVHPGQGARLTAISSWEGALRWALELQPWRIYSDLYRLIGIQSLRREAEMAKQHSHGRGRPLLATEHRHFAMLASVQGAQ